MSTLIVDAETTKLRVSEHLRREAVRGCAALAQGLEEQPPYPKYCATCGDRIADAAILKREEEEWQLKVPNYHRVYTCSEAHAKAWRKIASYQGVSDVRHCHECQRAFRSSAPKVPIYDYVMPPGVSVEDLLKETAKIRRLEANGYQLTGKLLKTGGFAFPLPSSQWFLADICSRECLDASTHNLDADAIPDFADVAYDVTPHVAIVAARTVAADRQLDRIEELLAKLREANIAATTAAIAEALGAPLTTAQSQLERGKRLGRFAGGGRRQPWLRVVRPGEGEQAVGE